METKPYRYKLSWGVQEKLDRFYKKFSKEAVFGKYPKDMAYETILSFAIDLLEAKLPTIWKIEDRELKEWITKWNKNKKNRELKNGR